MNGMESSAGGTAAHPRHTAVAVVRLLRPHQWTKNFLLFVPFLLSHQPPYLHRWVDLLLAFALFCLAASAGYIINDLHDLSVDRMHPAKKFRPLASGEVSRSVAIVLLVILLAGSALVSIFRLPVLFSTLLGIYLVLTVGYSLLLKARLLVDVFALAILYCLRLLAGGAAIALEVTPWLLAFGVFLFISLAFIKRYTELAQSSSGNAGHLAARDYRVEDMPLIAVFGAISGYMAVLVFAIYLNSETAREQYSQPQLLWLAGFLLLYWVTRVWFIAIRRELHDDPVVFALRDSVSWIAGILMVLIVLAAATLNIGS